MKKMRIFWMALLLAFSTVASAAVVRGKVQSTDQSPVADAVITLPGHESVRSSQDGSFELKEVEATGHLTVWATGFYVQTLPLKGQTELQIQLIPEDKYKYNETLVLPFRTETGTNEGISSSNLSKKDFALGSMSIDKALKGEVAGLQVTQKSGMTGEGAYFNLRGLRSLVSDNAPLIVLNGVPFLPNKNESRLISGYSRSVFQALNINDIQNITVLKGAEAALYGSMGSNGVIMIETDGAASDDLNTKISYFAQVGVNWNSKQMPLMKNQEYKSYLSDIGMTYYNNMETFFGEFPFLTDPNNIYSYLYDNSTDWQNVISGNSLVTDHLFRVEGGDAIAKYDISLGYTRDEGTLLNTASSRYHTQINTNVLVSQKFEIATTVGLAYLNGSYQEQGMNAATNPMLAAYQKAPLLSPFKSDINGNELATYSSYYFGASNNMDFAGSNPLALVETLTSGNRQYDVSAKVALTYKPTNDLSFNANVGLYYNYDQENMFIPGINNKDIMPIYDQYGQASNTVRVGVAETFNMYVGLNGAYKKTLDERNRLDANAGFQMITTSNEFDAGSGRNTPNDFYQTLGDVNAVGRYFFGYIDVWNWMSYYARVAHTYDDVLRTSVNVSIDGASSTGADAPQFGVFPSLSMTYMAKNAGWLSGVDAINTFNLRAEYGLTGNSRYSSKYGKYYYTSRPYQGISGIIRANVPNTELEWEKNAQFDLGMDVSMLNNRVDVSLGYYNSQSTDVLMISPNSSVYGTGVYYSNDAAISSDGVELSVNVTPIQTKDFRWVLGGNVAKANNSVKSLGGVQETLITLSDDAQLITRVGEDPYAFYGYETNGVFATTDEAVAANMKNLNGLTYSAGDVRYVDQNNDGYINEEDRVILGSASPDLLGGVFNRFQYKQFALDVNLAFSIGNEAYNAVRRSMESSSDFSNQSRAVNRRWTMEGQITDMPKASWGDVIGNNDFSDRWIEDASYVKLRDVTLSYSFNKPVWNFFQSGVLFVTGENLLTFTNYLGMDPEFSYSYSDALQGIDYAKVALPKTVKVGVNLKF